MDSFKAKLVIWALKLLACLSLKNAHRLGASVGHILWWGDSRSTRATIENIQLCYPDLSHDAQQRLIKNSLIETGKLFSEFGVVWEWPTEKTLGLIKSVEGKEHLDAIFEKGKGAIVLAPHHGNWEMVGLYLSSLRSMAALYKPPKIKALEDYMSSVRGRHGSELVPTNKRGVVRLFSILSKQGMVGILPDQVPGGTGGMFAPFMGVEANTIKLVSRLIDRTKCEVVSLCAIRRPNGDGFDMVFKPADSEIYSEDLPASIAALNRSIEAAIESHPEQYQWEYKRFKGAEHNGKKVYSS
ncbi:MAG: KDO2-lipid IV(A) lauroyltransferase [Oleiphilaceae bacterium]|jgi:KDO2-lipid IV(A) lauroyltransferase